MALKHHVAFLLAGALVVGGLSSGCAQNSGPDSVVATQSQQPTGLTALQRGQVREKALAAARAGWAAWQHNDVAGMKPYFAKTYIAYYEKLYAKYAAEGRTRVRVLKTETFDVTDMDALGTEVLVESNLKDLSYYVERSGARTQPTGKETTIQLTLDKQKDGSWMIVRMVMGNDIMN